MEQEVQVNLTLTLSVNAELSKSKIIQQLKKGLKDGFSSSISQPDITIEKVHISKVKEEAEIYGNN